MNKLCGRALVFGDEEQIKELEFQKLKDKVINDNDFKDVIKEYRKLENKIEELENERDEEYGKIEDMCIKKGIPRNKIYLLT